MAFINPMVFAATSAFMQIRAGAAQRRRYEEQARWKKINGSIEAAKHREQGVSILRQMNESLASVVAGAEASGVVAFQGSAQDRATFRVMAPGMEDFKSTSRNAELAMLGAAAQARDLQAAGKQAYLAGVAGAMGTLAGSAQQQQQLGTGQAFSFST